MAGATAEELAYGQVVGDQGGAIGEALGRIGELFQEPKLTDQDWVFDLAAQTVIIETAHQTLVDYEPVPDSAATLHRSITRATAECAGAMSPLRRGLDTRSTALIQEAGQGVQRCNQLLAESRPLLDAWVAERAEG